MGEGSEALRKREEVEVRGADVTRPQLLFYHQTLQIHTERDGMGW